MSRIHPVSDTASPDYEANRAAMQALVDDLNTRLEEIALGGVRPTTPATRPVASCCPASASTSCWTRPPFSSSALAGWQVYDEPVPAAGIPPVSAGSRAPVHAGGE